MKMKSLIGALFFMMVGAIANAQYVKVRIGFPVGVSVTASGRAPYAGAVWVGPEWVWHGGRYVCVPGYWARPKRHGVIWIPGHWKYTGRGYKWTPGHWK